MAATKQPTGRGPEGMVWIPGGEFSMGSPDTRTMTCGGSEAMGDARPIHRVQVNAFWADESEVTNAQFEKFAETTGYTTMAERTPRAEDLPDVPGEKLVAGSLVFTPPSGTVPLDEYQQWWRYQEGANWRHPEGPGSDIRSRMNHAVVHVAFEDVVAYATWAGKRLPTEAEWEFAARGGLAGKLYAWGDDFRPNAKWMANTFQGRFPVKNTHEDGFDSSAPVKSFPPNGYGLYDVAGNVWEWCSDWYAADYYAELALHGGVARNPIGPARSPDHNSGSENMRVQRGGSFLCTDQYCTRYMVGTRGKGEVTTSSNHVGFRCVRDATAGQP